MKQKHRLRARWCMTSLLLLLILVLMTGCWDFKRIQSRNYVTAVGLDFVDGKYVVYAQLIGFATVAKTSGGASPGGEPQVWVGKSTGTTITEAIYNLYKTSQEQLDWDHVNAMVFTEKALAKGIFKYLDGLTRFRSTDYTVWTFVTKDDLHELLSTTAFFLFSSLNTQIHIPMEVYKERSEIRPLQLYEVMSASKEPGRTLLLPSVTIAKEVWSKNKTPNPKQFLDGVYALRHGKKLARYVEADIKGLRWLQGHSLSHTMLTVYDQGKPVGTMRTDNPTHEITVRVHEGVPSVQLNVRVKCQVMELQADLSVNRLEQQIEQRIRDEILGSFKLANEQHVDLYELEHSLFKQHTRLWKELTDSGKSPYRFGAHQLEIDVQARIKLEGIFVEKNDV